jgi:hypothetical protein
MPTDASEDRRRRHERRVATVSAPCGPLALVGTHGVPDYPDGRLPDIPGLWRADGDAVVLVAAETDGLTVGEQPFTGEVRLTADPGPAGRARVAYGVRRLVVLVREGVWGVRDYDPESSARRAFRGLRVTPYDPPGWCPGAARLTTPAPVPFGCRTPTGASEGSGPAGSWPSSWAAGS